MKVLLVKMSSLGDVIHTLPAVTDLARAVKDVQLSWVVEESFRDIPALNKHVGPILPIAIRRWRRSWFRNRSEIASFRSNLKALQYDVVIDAQGLLKSAVVASMARGVVHGLNRYSAREPISSLFYDQRYQVSKDQHAVERLRKLFAQIFDYDIKKLPMDYGLASSGEIQSAKPGKPRLMFLHGTTWCSKHWPEIRWQALAQRAEKAGYDVILPYGDELERQRAERIAASVSNASVLPPGSLAQLTEVMRTCRGVVSVDTGLGHLAAALNLPLVGIYGPTNPLLTGPYSLYSDIVLSRDFSCIPCMKRECRYNKYSDSGRIHPPCFDSSTAEVVFDRLVRLMAKGNLV